MAHQSEAVMRELDPRIHLLRDKRASIRRMDHRVSALRAGPVMATE
jgi:hypothetical protein